LVGLYEEGDKPNNSIEYLKKNLGAPVEVDTVKLKAELEKTKEENAKLRKELEQYRKEVYMDRFSSKTSIKKMEIEQVIDIYAHFLYSLKAIKKHMN
jgi:regulator of replication initiation timing